MKQKFSNLFAVLIFWFFCIKTKEQRNIFELVSIQLLVVFIVSTKFE